MRALREAFFSGLNTGFGTTRSSASEAVLLPPTFYRTRPSFEERPLLSVFRYSCAYRSEATLLFISRSRLVLFGAGPRVSSVHLSGWFFLLGSCLTTPLGRVFSLFSGWAQL
ncbi:hypothetical protein NDU88_000475 [Pleurodeles waltl]|uniref:Uncharacterized protein n=1 Tax=Pleurodeles waltl TaxID=8319 RepID=A0AAV7S7U2_PLEWA|nr:hypothetical protein NDU88_000475 [Pleurodeles waltl]